MIEAFDIKPSWLGIELTEYSVMHSPEYMNTLLHSISALGVKITIDDFGSGSSSLTCIKRFGLDYIKIDKSLIDEIETDSNNFIIIKAIIQMAHCMSLKAVAEGVENKEQLNLLKQLGCDAVQGFIFGRPVSEKEFEKLYFSDQKGRPLSVAPRAEEDLPDGVSYLCSR
jgi:EAL domain-containing protein (putative c-di-GMP-specific phosphodiesterase class I)